jgi:hypothetical protein
VENAGAAKTPFGRGNDSKPLCYVARQPIFDREEKVFGYELLCRGGLENAFSGSDLEAASRATLDSSLLMGLDVLCDGRRCVSELHTLDANSRTGAAAAFAFHGGRNSGECYPRR